MQQILQADEMADSTIEARLARLGNLFISAGDMMLQTVEVTKQNAQQLTRLENTMAQLALQAANDRAEFEEFRRTNRAALDKMDRVLDYLMQRDERSTDE
ncbi:MAG: hypothetical protein AAFW75_10875 [Cyanobacteria bacterium J06636_16]